MTVSVPPEVSGLASAVVAFDLPGSTLELPDDPVTPRTWRRTLAALKRERLTGQLLAAVDQGALPASSEQSDQARSTHLSAMVHALRLERELAALVTSARTREVDLLALKGVASSRLDYDDPARRGFGDLDVLVQPAEVVHAQQLLEDLGFSRSEPPARPRFDERFGKSSTYVNSDGVEVDLHRTFVMGPYGLQVDLDELWQLPRDSFELGEVVVQALAPEARLLHACYSAVLGDYPPRLTPRRDLAEMALFGKADPEAVVQLAARWGAELLLATALVETWDTFALADETALITWARQYRSTPREERLVALYRQHDTPYSSLALRSLRLIKGHRQKLAFVSALTLPDRQFLEGRGTSLPRYLARGAGRALTGGRR